MTEQRTDATVHDIVASAGTTGATIGIAVGALAVSTSGVLIALADAPTEVSTFYRCALALPVLAVFAWLESRRNGLLDAREWGFALLRGFPSTLAIDGVALGWIALTALTNGVIGWLLVARYSPHVPSALGAALLLLTPVGSLLLGALILDERPAPVQIIGCAVILAVAYGASTVRRGSSGR
ncbi:EamA family transporter [Nocardia sp. CA-128927]|uniref:EamA family transporter n=1 Tax=Nocardia sp. CA-128927 TaxID=3239975 RepID=UPI003D986760